MLILDKYILSELLGPFFFGIAAFSSVFIGTRTLSSLTTYITEYGASIPTVTKLFIFSVPGVVVLTVPMSMLVACLLCFGRLSSLSEITAIKAGGVSFHRLAMPVILIALFGSIFCVYFNEFIVLPSKRSFNKVVHNEINKNVLPKSQENLVLKPTGGGTQRLIYARKYDQETGMLYNITMKEFNDNDKSVRMEVAESAKWQGNQFTLYDGVVYDLDTWESTTRTMHFAKHELPVDMSSVKSDQPQEPEDLSIKDLKELIKTLRSQNEKTQVYEMQLQKRFSIPVACFVFALIGIPLGLQPQRASTSTGFGISILIIFAYYGVMTVADALGEGSIVPVTFAVWIPNLVCFLTGVLLMRKAAS